MFQVWSHRAHRQRLSMPAKRQRDVRLRQRASHQNVSLDQITVAAVKSKIITICGQIGGSKQEVLLDSVSTVSLLRQDDLKHVTTGIEHTEPKLDFHLVTAAGENLPIVDQVSITVKLEDLERRHNFLVVKSLITPAILGADIIQKHKIVLDFSTMPVTVTQMQDKAQACVPAVLSHDQDSEKFSALWESGVALKRKWCQVAGIDMVETNSEVMIEDCAVPHYGEKVDYEFPKDVKMRKFKNLFITKSGTTVTSHHITTTGPPARVPPRRIPHNFNA